MSTKITVSTTVNAAVTKVWEYYTKPEHIVRWNAASEDWHTTKAENDLMVGGKFSSRMEAKDGSFGFDFGGVYDVVVVHEKIHYTLGDGRKAEIEFSESDNQTHVTVIFEAETQNTIELQQGGWQAILDSFKKYTESH